MAQKRKRDINNLRVGDKVEICGYRKTVSWHGRKPQKYGFVVNIDGAYILIRPRWAPKEFLVEKYPNEIRLVSK